VRKVITLLFSNHLYYIFDTDRKIIFSRNREKTLKSMKNLLRLRLFLSIFVGELKISTKRWLVLVFLYKILGEFYQNRIFYQSVIGAFDQNFAVLERIGYKNAKIVLRTVNAQFRAQALKCIFDSSMEGGYFEKEYSILAMGASFFWDTSIWLW